MADLVTLGFSVVDTILAFAGIVATLYGRYYFKEGLLVKTLSRGTVVVSSMFLHFLLETLGDAGILAVPDIVGILLEFGFTVALAYLMFAFIRDWKSLGES
jgi:hypothetical protein